MTVSWKNVFLGGNSLYHTNTVWLTVLFTPWHILYDGELLPENFCIYQPIKCQHILISNNSFLRIFKLWVLTILILNPWIVSDTSVISFHTLQYTHSLYLTPLKIATWLAEIYAIRYSMYKLISIYLGAFVGTIIVYTDIYTLVNYCPLQIQQVGFFVNKVAIEQVFLQELPFVCCWRHAVQILSPLLYFPILILSYI